MAPMGISLKRGRAPARMALAALAAVCAGCASMQARDPHPRVRLETTQGDITLELDRQHAPATVDNFLAYVAEHRYDGTVFHRVLAGFVVQGGGYDAQLHDRPRHAPIRLESANGLHNLRGSVAMARDEAPDSADCEFYINLVDNLKLDPHPDIPGREHGYAVFGHVVAGLDAVDRIAAVPVHTVDGAAGVPVRPVLIRRAELLPVRR